MPYNAVIIDEYGADQGPVDISAAQNDAQARDMAEQAGMKWLADSGTKRATVQISHDGHGLSVEVHA